MKPDTKLKNSLTVIIITLFIIFISINKSKASTELTLLEKIITHKINIEKQGVGVAIAIINGDNIEYLNVGVANKKNSQPITSATIFEIGSISKTFTSTALASMVNEGKIKLTEPVQKYLPKNVKLPNKNGKEITFLSLANHSSGLPRLPNNMPFADPLNPYADYTVELMYQFLNNYKLPREVGSQREYSNLGVGLLGHVLALIDNKSYQEMITSRVLTPLNMKNTFVNLPANFNANFSNGHNEQLDHVKHWQLSTFAGAGAIKSNITDMAQYLKANMMKSPMTKELTLVQNKTASFGNEDTNIGLSWIISEKNGHKYFMHNGATGGFHSFIAFNQTKQKGIVILANSTIDIDYIGYAYLTNKLATIKLNTPFKVSAEKLKKLNGKFELAPNFILTISNQGKQLIAQATGQPKLSFTAISGTEFINSALKVKLVFVVNEHGKAKSLTLHQGGQEIPGSKL